MCHLVSAHAVQVGGLRIHPAPGGGLTADTNGTAISVQWVAAAAARLAGDVAVSRHSSRLYSFR